MVASKPFSQYLAEARARKGAQATSVTLPAGPAKDSNPAMGALSWLVDILSRPMRAVENVPNQTLNEELKRKQAAESGTPYNELGGVFNVLTAPIRGFFSTNPADQPTGADIIEKTYDVKNYGTAGYEDVTDNVSPLVKGAGGLTMDIALDPLTWIPGGQIIKGAQLAGKGLKGLAVGADALVAGSGVGKALGSDVRVASRAAAAEQARIAENNAFLAQRAAQPYQLQNTAFGANAAPVVPEARIAASDIVANLNKVETPSIATPKLTEGLFSQAIGPATKTEAKASARLAEAMKASDIVTPPPAAAAGAIDEAALMDSVGAPRGSAIGEQFAATGMVPNIMAQLDKIKPGTIAEKPTNFAATLPDVAPQIAVLETKLQKLVKDSAAGAASPTVAKRVDAQIKSVQAEIKALRGPQKAAAPVDTAKSARSFSASTALKGILADPVEAQALKAALGDSVVAKLAGIKNPATLMRATEHLGKVIRGEVGTSTSKIQSELATELRKQYDIKVPGTEVPSIVGTSAVDTTITAEAQVAKAAGQDLQDVPWLGGYTQEQIDDVIRDMPEYLKNDFLNVEGYRYKTLTGALSTSDMAGAGLHKYAYEFNQMDQWTLMNRLLDSNRKEIAAYNNEMRKIGDKASVIAAGNRAEKLKRAAINKMELALRWLDSKGVSAWIGINENRIRLYAHQMLREFNLVDPRALDLAYFNKPTSVPMTNIMDAVVALYTKPNLSDAAISKILRKEIKGADNFLLTTEPKRFGHRPGATKPSNGLWEPNYFQNTKKVIGWYRLWTPAEVEAATINMLRGSAPDIEKVVLHNEEMALSRTISEAKDLTDDVARSIFEDANNPAAFGDLISKIANVPAHTADRGAANWVKPQIDPVVGKPATDYWPNDVVHDAQHIQKLVSAAAKDPKVAREALAKLNVDEAMYAGKSAEEIVALMGSRFDGVGPNGRVVNEAMFNDAVNEMALNDMLQAGRVARIRELVQYGKGKEQVIHKYNQVNIQMSKGMADFKLNVNNIAKKHSGFIPGTTTTVLAQALRDMAIPGKASTGAVAAARADLELLVWSVFGNPNNGPYAMGIWQRAAGDLTDLQVYMKKAKLPYTVDLTNAETRVAKGEYKSLTEAGVDDWKNWVGEIDDPLKFLSDMYWAGSMLHADKAAAALFVARAGVTSTRPAAGFTKIPELDLFEHPLLGHMPKNTYIKNDILQEVGNIERMIMADYSPKSPFGKWLNENYVPTLSAWKKGVTIYRLGHHVRNLLSSEGIQWTVEGSRHYLGSTNAAMKTLMKHKSYEGVDWAQTVTELDTMRMPTGGDKLFTFGKNEITVDALYEAAEKHGLFTDFRIVEDLFDDTPATSFSKFVDKATFKDTALERMAGGLSEYQSHFSRLHHFTQILMKQGTKGKNWEQAIEEAAKKVRRHHPDGMTLTPFERAYLKPLIPFYSWFRQMIPVIAEGIVQNPGRFMVYPKASYNMAVAMGVDPQSLQEPFPEGELFPSFITDQLTGPVTQINGNYFTGAPGYAYADILNQFVADPKKGLIGMVTPFIKVPGELITGTKWDTGTQINDYSDYIDAQIPGINYLSNFTGTSTTGSVVGLLSGQGIDRQYSVDKGNKTPLDQGLSVSNWFSGLGLQNISKENYKNLAEIEKRNREAQAAEEAAGTARNPF